MHFATSRDMCGCFWQDFEDKSICWILSIFCLLWTHKFAGEEWGFQGSKGFIGICMLFAFLVSEHKVYRWRMRNIEQCCRKEQWSCSYCQNPGMNLTKTHPNTHPQNFQCSQDVCLTSLVYNWRHSFSYMVQQVAASSTIAWMTRLCHPLSHNTAIMMGESPGALGIFHLWFCWWKECTCVCLDLNSLDQ